METHLPSVPVPLYPPRPASPGGPRSSEGHPVDRHVGSLSGFSALLAALVAVVMACGDDPMTPATPDPPVPTKVAISPASAAFRSIGDTARMIVTVSDQYGQAMGDVGVVWNSSDTAVAAVTEGLVTAVGNGSATLTATAGSATASAEVAVEQSVAEVAVAPATHTLVAFGDTARFVAEARDGNGHAVTGAEFVWSVNDESIVTVDTGGLVTAAANGSAQVTATSGSQTASAEVTVEQQVAEVSVTPPPRSLEAFGDTVSLSAGAVDANGHEVAEAAFTWMSDDPLVAVVDRAGLVTAVGNGTAEIAAAVGAVSGTVALTVAQQPGTVVVSPMADTLEAFGDTVRLLAEAMDANGHAVGGTAFTWTSGDTLVAVVDGTGLVTAMGNGVTTVAAEAGEAMGASMVTVMQSTDSVIVTPAADSIAPGEALHLSAEAVDANGNAVVGATFSWSSSHESVATVDASGLVRGASEGTATISAEAGSASGTAQITVSDPDRAALVALYEATDGPNWVNSENWLTDAPLRDWHGVTTSGGRVSYLDLSRNGLTGSIPAQLGTLTHLVYLSLGDNALSGPIPGELGNTSLQIITLYRNNLSGPIPPQLGRLSDLSWLFLFENALSGPIPPELGNNTSLKLLYVGGNELSGSIPSELGQLENLRELDVSDNELSGSIPPELGQLENLKELNVAVNLGLRGEIPPDVLALDLDLFESYTTGLCVPRTGDFESYISRDGWIGYACGETEPGFQIQLVFHPETPGYMREAMRSEAEYWMEILRDTEAPDLFGQDPYFRRDWAPTLPPIVDDIVVVIDVDEGPSRAGISGLLDLLRHRIPYRGRVTLSTGYGGPPQQLELTARHELGHVLGIGTLWHIRRHIRDPSTEEEVRDTYVVLPLAEGAFDAAGGTSYTGPKIPLHQHGDGGLNGHWRTEVFGSELMSWGWGDYVPTSAVTLQALADLGYTVDLGLADPYTLLGAAADAAIAPAAPPPFELGWEAPPSVVVCRPRSRLVKEPNGLLSDSRHSGLGSNALRVDAVDIRSTPRADCEDLMRR